MKAIEALVRAKLEGQVGQEEAAALWEKLWAAYQANGADGAERFLQGLLKPLDPKDGGDGET